MAGFGLAGFFIALPIRETPRPKMSGSEAPRGFFLTALREEYYPLMATAAVFGAGFGVMNAFFPLYARTIGLTAGMFFIFYGVFLLLVRVLLGSFLDRLPRHEVIVISLIGFGLLSAATPLVVVSRHTMALGAFFGILQGISYPAMMARMVDRAGAHNRGVVVGLFTGSFGAGINAFLLLWGWIAETRGLDVMYWTAAAVMFVAAGVLAWVRRDRARP
ncbi:MAG: MFS transporter [Pseudomonadota bacterium]